MHLRGVPEAENSNTILTILSCCTGLLVLAVFLIFRISSRLKRIERLLGQGSRSERVAAEVPDAAETSPGGAFETFLNEDPSRRELPKKEQFAAYREWRQQNGMNWSVSTGSQYGDNA